MGNQITRLMNREKEEWLYTMLTTGVVLGAGVLVKVAVNNIYESGAAEDPPMNPASSDVPWGKAIAYTIFTGAAVGLAQLLVRRGTASTWKRVTGSLPNNINKVHA